MSMFPIRAVWMDAAVWGQLDISVQLLTTNNVPKRGDYNKHYTFISYIILGLRKPEQVRCSLPDSVE